ncbi:hypothetical protein [Paenibacillus radicis (ex Gao et al. 2016)]|uniref:DUF4365 domain-containing protein n=1 Tax=Paenibacillus radicis (ex Gao et al. 2016) TaxID=1737354 RepID=A0A917HQP6_9BACL|nr:hypothetical protein [Paenibacillus radicis (ex Gao et al. 2016)]GGG86221.1 hypothetical protein GCM10010918_50470 [Paenibacillus radicis (ex Gao et al. 2016)]
MKNIDKIEAINDLENEIINDNFISSKQKGNITENRVVELITLGSRGQLTCYMPNSDDDGIDIIVNPKGKFNPLFIQVKSRYTLNSKGKFIQNVGINTFNSHINFYIVFLYFNQISLEVETIWLVPSIEFESNAFLKKAGDTYKSFYRITANPVKSNDKWEKYKIEKNKLGSKILEILLVCREVVTIS